MQDAWQDWKIADWDIKHQHLQNQLNIIKKIEINYNYSNLIPIYMK